MKRCEYCSKEHDGKYGSGRFCCQECARGFSTKAKRKEINKKVSKTLLETCKIRKQLTKEERRLRGCKKAGEISHKKWLERTAVVSTREQGARVAILLNVTNGFVEQYRKDHPVCEICGRTERIKTNPTSSKTQKLAIDHVHGKNEFRGLLCNRCNYMLGWIENVGVDRILSYLNKDTTWKGNPIGDGTALEKR